MTDESHFDINKASHLDNEGRIRELRIPELLKDIGGVMGGMTCVDLGAGTGTFALRIAARVGEKGKVFAIDDSAAMLSILKSRKPPPQIVPVQSDFTATGLDSGIADFCLAAFILHETKEPQKILDEAFRLLKPGGRLLAVEWRAEFDSPGPPQRIRISPEKMEAMFRQAGFKDFTHQNWTEKHYYGTSEKTQ
ncbi:class I SAM-dependent methyltransferase [Dehalogenimonas sp. THU2]|uniref:class I SAM-dependent methyltransferase n=1 Tax=Dehalogenimonas sp. THU2 TaxID=3151121 RepID=UPI0032184CE3